MSVESDLVTALAAVAGGRVYPLAAPEKAAKPLVIYKPQANPLVLLNGSIAAQRTLVVFECWGESFASAMSTATAVQAAIAASALRGVAVEAPEDGYDPQVDEYVRPVAYQFWQ
jgi:hypothetical protein